MLVSKIQAFGIIVGASLLALLGLAMTQPSGSLIESGGSNNTDIIIQSIQGGINGPLLALVAFICIVFFIIIVLRKHNELRGEN